MYRLIGGLRSRAFRVAWMLEELGLVYEHVAVPPRSPEVLAVNPSGKVPVLETPEGVIHDSVAIMTYLADRHGGFTHAAGTFARAEQDAATQMINDEIDGVLWTAARHSFILPEDKRVAEVKPSLKWEFAQNLARVDARLAARDYLAGDAPTVPDFLLSHCIGWAGNAKFDTDGAAIAAHYARMTERPAFRKVADLRG